MPCATRVAQTAYRQRPHRLGNLTDQRLGKVQNFFLDCDWALIRKLSCEASTLEDDSGARVRGKPAYTLDYEAPLIRVR